MSAAVAKKPEPLRFAEVLVRYIRNNRIPLLEVGGMSSEELFRKARAWSDGKGLPMGITGKYPPQDVDRVRDAVFIIHQNQNQDFGTVLEKVTKARKDPLSEGCIRALHEHHAGMGGVWKRTGKFKERTITQMTIEHIVNAKLPLNAVAEYKNLDFLTALKQVLPKRHFKDGRFSAEAMHKIRRVQQAARVISENGSNQGFEEVMRKLRALSKNPLDEESARKLWEHHEYLTGVGAQ